MNTAWETYAVESQRVVVTEYKYKHWAVKHTGWVGPIPSNPGFALQVGLPAAGLGFSLLLK